MSLATADLLGVEVFAVGLHNGHEYTAEDLDDIVAAYKDISERLGYDPPLKLDHDEVQPELEDTPKDGGPAFGWVANVRRKGQKLLCDFKSVPQKLADLIEAGAYRARSAEIWWDIEFEGKAYRRALKAVALLGVKMPAVKKLKDIFKLYRGKEAALYDDDERKAKFDSVWFFDVDSDDDSDEELTEEELDELFGTIRRRMEILVKNKTGAPRTRHFLKDIEDRLRSFMKGKKVPNLPKEYSVPLFKTEVNYREGGTSGNRCADCRWYSSWGGNSAGSCSLVEGSILTNDVCDRFEALPKSYDNLKTTNDSKSTPKEGKMVDKVMTVEEFEDLQSKLAEAQAKAAKVDELEAENKKTLERVELMEQQATQRWASDTVAAWHGDVEGNRDFLLEAVKQHGQDSDFVRNLIDRETAHAKQIKDAGLFSENGHGTTPQIGGPAEKFEAAVAEALEKGMAKTRVEAISLVARTQPKLYRDHSEAVAGMKLTYPGAE